MTADAVPLAAAVSWAREDTVVVVPPAPPLVLKYVNHLSIPSILGVGGSPYPPF